jgi:tripartite ATP-independent transporter DctP family solute receptor
MKKFLVILLCFSLVFAMAACGGSDSTEGNETSGEGDAAAAETYKFTIGHVYSTDSLEAAMTNYLAEQIEERTEGRVKVEVFANEILGSERETCEQVVMGTCDLTFSEGSMWSTVTGVTELGVYGLPFMYSSVESANYAVKNLITPGLAKICEDNDLSIMPLYTVQSGFRHLFTVEKPVKSLSDISGLKVRVPEVDLYVQIWKSLGSNPTTTAFSECYQALQQGVVNACEIDFANCVQQNWHEVVKYCTKTGHLAALNVAMINKDKWESFPEDIQQIIKECAADAEDFNHGKRAEADAEYISDIEAAGVEIIELDANALAEMKAACQSIYDEFIALGVEDLINEVAEKDASL